ncbi:MAG: hypothetical protein IT335_02595, partial [Thermomicrobiales bacterium]|nr:hypothetical protein [Thermomicrobiales bacterium]
MSTQLLTDETFSAQNVAIATRGKQESGRMTLMGVTVKSLLFIAITMVFGAIGWNRALSV